MESVGMSSTQSKMFKGENSKRNPFDGMSSSNGSQIYRGGKNIDDAESQMYKQFGTDSEQIQKFPDSEMDGGSEMQRVESMVDGDEMMKMGSIHEKDIKLRTNS